MKPVNQTRFGGKDAPLCEQGNCMVAAIASVLEIPLDEAPDLKEISKDDDLWWNQLNRWLTDRFGLYILPVEHAANGFGQGYWLATVTSRTLAGSEHLIVMHGDEVVHNPNPRDSRGLRRDQYEPKQAWFLIAHDPASYR